MKTLSDLIYEAAEQCAEQKTKIKFIDDWTYCESYAATVVEQLTPGMDLGFPSDILEINHRGADARGSKITFVKETWKTYTVSFELDGEIVNKRIKKEDVLSMVNWNIVASMRRIIMINERKK